jgi:hypothetical protein
MLLVPCIHALDPPAVQERIQRKGQKSGVLVTFFPPSPSGSCPHINPTSANLLRRSASHKSRNRCNPPKIGVIPSKNRRNQIKSAHHSHIRTSAHHPQLSPFALCPLFSKKIINNCQNAIFKARLKPGNLFFI